MCVSFVLLQLSDVTAGRRNAEEKCIPLARDATPGRRTPLPFLEKNFERKLGRKDEFNVEWFRFMDSVKLEHVEAKRKISRQYIVIHETTHRGKESSEGINTPSFFSPYHFRIIFARLINYSTISYLYFSPSIPFSIGIYAWNNKDGEIYRGNGIHARANSSTLMSIVRGLITRVRYIIIIPGVEWWFAVKTGSLTKSRAAIIYAAGEQSS